MSKLEMIAKATGICVLVLGYIFGAATLASYTIDMNFAVFITSVFGVILAPMIFISAIEDVQSDMQQEAQKKKKPVKRRAKKATTAVTKKKPAKKRKSSASTRKAD